MPTLIKLILDKLNPQQVLLGESLKERYYHIWKMEQPLNVVAVILPKSTEEVSHILKICNQFKQSVVVHGGLTNLVGGTEVKNTDLVISLEKMNQIEEIDLKSRTITVQAGCILESVQILAKENEMLFPLNFGAKGSAQIGGIISSNAGGLRVFRFGMTRNLVIGLEAVMADGTIISSLKKIIKDNSGYDLKQLFIGSEGTLGIVTRAVLKIVEAPQSRTSAMLATNDYEKVIQLLKFMDRSLAGNLSGFELIWGESYKTMTEAPAQSKPPLPHGHRYYILIETLGNNYQQDLAILQDLLEEALANELIDDAVLAQSDSDLNWFWTIREDVHVLASQCTFDHHFDISLPIPSIGKTIDDIVIKLKELPEVERVFPFGHVADGNIHFIIGKKNDSQSLRKQIDQIVYEPIKALGGSVSAEHGIGVHKKAYLSLCRNQEEINLMKLLKKSLDPNSILNVGKIID